MNDRIAQMAREADLGFGNDDGDMPDALVGKEAIARFARLVAEDCAKLAYQHVAEGKAHYAHVAIRARYSKEG